MSGMTRRNMLAASALAGLFGQGLLSRSALAAQSAPTPWRNWSGTLACQPSTRVAPLTEAQLIEFLTSTTGKLRPVGSGHSFSPLVPTEGDLLVLDKLAGVLRHDDQAHLTTFGAGTRLGDTGLPLKSIGRALHNLPDIDRQTFAGALATGTHGAGSTLGGLAAYIKDMRMVSVAGDSINLSAQENSSLFNAARVSLGALGIITEVTTESLPAYRLKSVSETVDLKEALQNADAMAAKHRHFELFPIPYASYTIRLLIDETDEPYAPLKTNNEDEANFFGMIKALMVAPAATRGPVLDGIMADMETTVEVDDAHMVLANIRNNRFNEMEYSIPLKHGVACLEEVLDTIKEQSIDVVFPLEYRTIASDDTAIGMHSGNPDQQWASISIHQIFDEDFQPYFDIIEPIFWKYGGRPHWGKVHSLAFEQLTQLYPEFEAFCALRQELDPQGRLLNPHLEKIFGITA